MDELLTTIEEVKAGKYQKKLVSSASIEENAKGGFALRFLCPGGRTLTLGVSRSP